MLSTKLVGDAWLLDWEDPEDRVKAFLLNVEQDINRYLSRSETEGEALLRYLRSLCNAHASDGLPSSDSTFECSSCEGFSEVESLSEDESVGEI